jgi:hypothetical protein
MTGAGDYPQAYMKPRWELPLDQVRVSCLSGIRLYKVLRRMSSYQNRSLLTSSERVSLQVGW